MPPILDVAIGTIFVFLLFSIIVTALNEIVLSFFDKRADFLRQGLGEMLHEPQDIFTIWKKLRIKCFNWLNPKPKLELPTSTQVLARNQAVYENPADSHTRMTVANIIWHPLVYGFSKGYTAPSYISSGHFARSVIELLVPVINESGTLAAMTKPSFETVKQAIDKIPSQPVRITFATLLREAEGDVEKFVMAIEHWFDQNMERVSGWYKRYAQTWLFFLAFGLASVCNVDTIHIIQVLSRDPQVRAAVVEQAEKYSDDEMAQISGSNKNNIASGTTSSNSSDRVTKFNDGMRKLGGMGIPIGWDADSRRQFHIFSDKNGKMINPIGEWQWARIFSALAGCGLTALAASLGAPFWFDTLQRFINLRANGRAPNEAELRKREPVAVQPESVNMNNSEQSQ